jgi:hypothetical protein
MQQLYPLKGEPALEQNLERLEHTASVRERTEPSPAEFISMVGYVLCYQDFG